MMPKKVYKPKICFLGVKIEKDLYDNYKEYCEKRKSNPSEMTRKLIKREIYGRF